MCQVYSALFRADRSHVVYKDTLRFNSSDFTICVAETSPGEILSPDHSLDTSSDPWCVNCSVLASPSASPSAP